VLVLGAGPTGLGAARRLRDLGHADWLVLEGADRPGGLAASVVDEAGFTWDLGGHVQFSHYAEYDRVLDAAVGDWGWHDRESWIWIEGRFIPYPIQYNVHRFAPEDGAAILSELERAARASAPTPEHFGDWLRRSFGDTLARKFMLPYNAKTWGYPLEDLGFGWIGERVPKPDVERVRRTLATGRDDVSWGPNNRFRFPRQGGTGAIWSGVARGLGEQAIRYGARVVGVDTEARRVRLANGESLAWDTLISTLPLDRLAGLIEPEAAALRRAAGGLMKSAVHCVGVGLRGGRPDSLATKGWMYFPEEHSPHYRVTVFSNYADSHVPEPGAWSLLAEVCETPHRPVDAGSLPRRVLEALRKDGLVLPGAEVLSVWHRRLEHGYPTPGLGRDATLAELQPALKARRIFSRGRFGGWKYEVSNQDHSFMQGVELVERLARGTPEVTYPDPVRANSGEFLA
jgi:protoporphyrinogen oxidase